MFLSRIWGNQKERKEIVMEDIKLKPCPFCGGEIATMCGLVRTPQIYARCKSCKEEYDLPNVKLKTWKSNPIRISKTTIRKAAEEWNKLA